jgi:hypothetical protein
MVQIIKNGKIVMRGHNLAPILRYQRKHGIHVVKVTQHGKHLTVTYNDGARCETNFADASVLKGWIANRKKYGVFP